MPEKILTEIIEKWRRSWSNAREFPPYDIIISDIMHAYAKSLVPDDGGWFPIESLPYGKNVMLFWPYGEHGGGGIECAMVFRIHDGTLSYWTHGGPNSGSDWQPRNDEKPTHWRPLPPHPEAGNAVAYEGER